MNATVVILCAIVILIASIFFTRRQRDITERTADLDSKAIDLRNKANQIENEQSRLEQEKLSFAQYSETKEDHLKAHFEKFSELAKSISDDMRTGRRWLARAIAEYVDVLLSEDQCWLSVKPNPAESSSQLVSRIRVKAKDTVERLKLLEYQIASYEEYFPFLVEYRDAILAESVDLTNSPLETLSEADPALAYGYLSREEYAQLSTQDKFQLALDRYWQKRKSQAEIGRVYERYIGYIYETSGWTVSYQGILKGFEDFGRDLICKMGNKTRIIQCKCWAKNKLIREKHLFQLYGTVVMYHLKNPQEPTSAVLSTTTNLSDDACAVAAELGIEIEKRELTRYPMIKCNVNKVDGTKIFHLPFDQQYDRVLVGDIDGECYVATVAEAEASGFRRAFRWHGTEAENVNG